MIHTNLKIVNTHIIRDLYRYIYKVYVVKYNNTHKLLLLLLSIIVYIININLYVIYSFMFIVPFYISIKVIYYVIPHFKSTDIINLLFQETKINFQNVSKFFK